MSNAPRDEPFKVTAAAERMEPVEELWNSIAAERGSEPFSLSEAQREELDRRLPEFDEQPRAFRG